MRLHQLILQEMMKRFSYITLPDHVLKNIQSRINLDLLSYDPDMVRKVILQVEALYVFAIFKSTLSS